MLHFPGYRRRQLNLLLQVCLLLLALPVLATDQAGLWMKFEKAFYSSKKYANPLYDVQSFNVRFTSPSGRVKIINGFWDGDQNWKVRFAPDEKGTWSWESFCSDEENEGLNQLKGSFVCKNSDSNKAIYRHGAIIHSKGSYHLRHTDGTPFFWAGCTAWNGTLKSTEQEWDEYLSNRAGAGYSIIQFVTTQWRGCEKNSLGQVAFEGSGRIELNPGFFKHLDTKIDKINEYGLVAAPVLLWALATVQGRELSPGYYLPEAEAILLARYMVARYGANHVVWILGGDGNYTGENEQRWKNIGRSVFKEDHPGAVALHPGGTSWIGEAYASESWLDIIGYQSGHSNSNHAINFINKGQVADRWNKLPPRPVINMEPVYEEIQPNITARDIRNAAYWSILNAPTAGFTYGSNGIWPWLRKGELILNHSFKGEGTSRWHEAINLPGSVQIGYLSRFMRSMQWWKLKPALELLVEQPGDKIPADFIAVSKSDDDRAIVVYTPGTNPIQLYNLNNYHYDIKRFDPVSNQTTKAEGVTKKGILQIAVPEVDSDYVLVLERKD